MNNKTFLQIDKNDNVAVALQDVFANQKVIINNNEYTAVDDIQVGHKIALKKIAVTNPIIKYGYPIGNATNIILPGQLVHIHNMKTNLGTSQSQEYYYNPQLTQTKKCLKENLVFNGYSRDDGKVGVRNEIWIINTVGCCNTIAEKICSEGSVRFANRNIDGVFQFSHPFGCSQMGEDLTNTQNILSSLVKHPNAGAVLIIGLGCENNNITEFKKVLGPYNEDRVKFLNLQDVENDVEEGLIILENLVTYAEKFNRSPVPISKLTLGLKCGGSDAFSGITANPLVGEISDNIINNGGSAILTEVPEMFGAETILMNRAINKNIFNKIVRLINNFKIYFTKHGQVVYDNPSPGNKKGGITSLNEKSLGCIRKGGYSNIVDVLEYGEILSTPGLNLLNGPGNDIVAITTLAASGAQMILFTTGRGTPLGGPVPTVKISSNSELSKRKNNWIDFNAGKLLEAISMQELSGEFLDYIIKIASGELSTRNEKNDCRQIAFFKQGVIL